MAAAKTVQASTLDFLLTDTAGLDVADCLLAMVAALTADGHFDATRSLLALALKKKVPAVDLREASKEADRDNWEQRHSMFETFITSAAVITLSRRDSAA